MRRVHMWVILAGWLLTLAVVGVASRADAGESTPSVSGLGPSSVQPSAPSPTTGMPMTCPMMAGMHMGQGMMCSMGMSGMNASGMSMNHGTAPAVTLTDLAQNISLRDILQIVQEVLAVQEQVLEALPTKQAAGIRRDVVRLKERSRELMTEIRGMVSAAARGE